MGDVTTSFGDRVRIRASPLTNSLGVGGLHGVVYGETTPSYSGVEVIGEVTNDFALNVMLEDRGKQLWFAPELVEFVDHAPGTQVKIGDRHFIRGENGNWDEVLGSKPPLKRDFVSWLLSSFRERP